MVSAATKRSPVPRSTAQIFGLYFGIPWLRNQVLVSLAVGALSAGFLLLGLCAIIDTVDPIIGLPNGISRPLFSIIAILIVACLLYGHFIERHWIEITRTRIRTPKIRQGSDSIRIVHLSDFHCTREDTLEKRLPDLVESLSPDLILMTGDYLGSRKGIPVLTRLCSSLRSAHGVFAVVGNHEVWYTPDVDLFSGTGVFLLENEIRSVSIRGVSVSLVGISVEEEKEGIGLLKTLSPEEFNILLYHYPDLIEEASRHRVDLQLSGHTHGGQVALPLFGAIVTFSRGWKRFERGLYRVGESLLYVSRGVGSDGGIFPTVRFFARPEIAVIDLIPEAAFLDRKDRRHPERPIPAGETPA